MHLSRILRLATALTLAQLVSTLPAHAGSKYDYHAVLGVTSRATLDEIKSAYRKIAFATHSDRNPGDRTKEEKFKIAAEAYEVLRDPAKRAQYDRFEYASVRGETDATSSSPTSAASNSYRAKQNRSSSGQRARPVRASEQIMAGLVQYQLLSLDDLIAYAIQLMDHPLGPEIERIRRIKPNIATATPGCGTGSPMNSRTSGPASAPGPNSTATICKSPKRR